MKEDELISWREALIEPLPNIVFSAATLALAIYFLLTSKLDKTLLYGIIPYVIFKSTLMLFVHFRAIYRFCISRSDRQATEKTNETSA